MKTSLLMVLSLTILGFSLWARVDDNGEAAKNHYIVQKIKTFLPQKLDGVGKVDVIDLTSFHRLSLFCLIKTCSSHLENFETSLLLTTFSGEEFQYKCRMNLNLRNPDLELTFSSCHSSFAKSSSIIGLEVAPQLIKI